MIKDNSSNQKFNIVTSVNGIMLGIKNKGIIK